MTGVVMLNTERIAMPSANDGFAKTTIAVLTMLSLPTTFFLQPFSPLPFSKWAQEAIQSGDTDATNHTKGEECKGKVDEMCWKGLANGGGRSVQRPVDMESGSPTARNASKCPGSASNQTVRERWEMDRKTCARSRSRGRDAKRECRVVLGQRIGPRDGQSSTRRPCRISSW
jgi:hypothetical protein